MKTILLTMVACALSTTLIYGQVRAIDAAKQLQAKADEPIVYIPKKGTTTLWRFVKVQYRGEQSTEGFFNVDGKPSRLKITSSNPELMRVNLIGDKDALTDLTVDSRLGEQYTFSKPGDVTITVTVGDESKTLIVKIIELPIEVFPSGTSSAQVIEILGLPDEKRKVFVSWPDSENIDGIFYMPQAGDSVMAEHWRYKAYTGLVVSIINGGVNKIASNTSADVNAKAEHVATEDALFHNWTDSAGKFSLEAKFIELKDGQVYLERKDNGKTIKIPMSRLSKEDQKWVRDELKRRTEEKQKSETKKGARSLSLSTQPNPRFGWLGPCEKTHLLIEQK